MPFHLFLIFVFHSSILKERRFGFAQNEETEVSFSMKKQVLTLSHKTLGVIKVILE